MVTNDPIGKYSDSVAYWWAAFCTKVYREWVRSPDEHILFALAFDMEGAVLPERANAGKKRSHAMDESVLEIRNPSTNWPVHCTKSKSERDVRIVKKAAHQWTTQSVIVCIVCMYICDWLSSSLPTCFLENALDPRIDIAIQTAIEHEDIGPSACHVWQPTGDLCEHLRSSIKWNIKTRN